MVVFLYLVDFYITLIRWADTSSAPLGEQMCPAGNHAQAACGPLLRQPKSQNCAEVSEWTDKKELMKNRSSAFPFHGELCV